MRTIQRILAGLCGILILLTASAASANDGFDTSYTYTYDYWEDAQESPDAYRVSTVIDSMTLGLENLGNQRIKRPQSLFVKDQDLYICDTGNNRILQVRRTNSGYKLVRIIDEVFSTDHDYELSETFYMRTKEYEGYIDEYNDTEKKIRDLEKQAEAQPEENTEAAAETEAASEGEPAGTPETPEAAGETAEGENAEGEAAAESEQPEAQGETGESAEKEIDLLRAHLDELQLRIDKAHDAAAAAEENARIAGCRIWRYETWSKNEEGIISSRLNNPNDVSVDDAGNLYIADTNNERVLKLDKDCGVLWEFTKPLDATFDQKLSFLPKKLVVDVAERVYALCQNVNKGLVKYEADGTFSGFIGANTVSVSMADYIWKRYFQTKEQRAQTENFVPTEYENIYIDPDGFIYATNIVFSEGDLKWDNAKPIRRLNSLGSDILIKNDRFPPIGDLTWVSGGTETTGPSRFTDITVMNDEIYVGLDKTRGRLFGYDNQGVLLWAFGTTGNVEGAFTGAKSIEHMGSDLMVLDEYENSVTVFKTTEYGQMIYDATKAYLEGEYDRSAELWQEVLKMNANYPLAFRGIGRAVLRRNEYEDAMEWFKLAHDRENYGRAFKLYRKEWVEKNVWWIILIAAVLLIVPLAIGRIKRMKWEVSEHERSKVRK